MAPVEVICLSDVGAALQAPLLAAARALCTEYLAVLEGLGVPIDSYQNFRAEIAALPAGYAPPRGGVWLALAPAPPSPAAPAGVVHLGCRGAYVPVGYVGLRDLGGGRGEVKRLYVQPAARRAGAGRALSAALEAAARAQGFRELVLDSLGRLAHARPLYEALGFEACEPYNYSPLGDVYYVSGGACAATA